MPTRTLLLLSLFISSFALAQRPAQNPIKPGWIFEGVIGKNWVGAGVYPDSASLPALPRAFTGSTGADSTYGFLAYTKKDSSFWGFNSRSWQRLGGALAITGGDTTVFSETTDSTGNIFKRIIVAGPNNKLTGYASLLYDSANGTLRIRRPPGYPIDNLNLWVEGLGYFEQIRSLNKTELYNRLVLPSVAADSAYISADTSVIKPLGIRLSDSTVVRLPHWPGGGGSSFDSTNLSYRADTLAGKIASIPTVASYGKNATRDSTILLLSNGTRFAAKDSVGSGGGGVTLGALNGLAKDAKGAGLSGSTLYMQSADASFPGLVSIGTQTFAGDKTFTGLVNTQTILNQDPNATGTKFNIHRGYAGMGMSDGVTWQFNIFPGWKYTWNGGGNGTANMSTTGTSEWMRLSSAGLELNVPFTPPTQFPNGTSNSNAIKQYYYLKGGVGGTGKTGVGTVGETETQWFTFSSWRYCWNGGDNLNASGTNEWMRLNSSGLGVLTAANPNSTLQVNGSVSTKMRSVTGATNILATDYTILINASSGASVANLPTAVGITGRIYIIKKTDSSGNAVTVNTTSSQTIDGATTYSLATQYKYVQVQSDGTNWSIIGNN